MLFQTINTCHRQISVIVGEITILMVKCPKDVIKIEKVIILRLLLLIWVYTDYTDQTLLMFCKIGE